MSYIDNYINKLIFVTTKMVRNNYSKFISRSMKPPIYVPSAEQVYKLISDSAFEHEIPEDEIISELYDRLINKDLAKKDHSIIYDSMKNLNRKKPIDAIDLFLEHLSEKFCPDELETKLSSLKNTIYKVSSEISET